MKWFKHDSDASQDNKLQNVLLDYGLEGYGLYWHCLELIAGKVDSDSVTFELEHDARVIARNVGCTPQKVEEMMRYFVNIGLFENANGVITCLKMAKRLDKSMTSNAEMRKTIGMMNLNNTQLDGYVYFIEKRDSSNSIIALKIGRSKNPTARLSEISKLDDNIGFKLKIIHKIQSDNCVDLETDLHRRFKHLNIINEWFRPGKEIYDTIPVDYVMTTTDYDMQDKIRIDKNRDKDLVDSTESPALASKKKKPSAFDDMKVTYQERAFNVFWSEVEKKKVGKADALKAFLELTKNCDEETTDYALNVICHWYDLYLQEDESRLLPENKKYLKGAGAWMREKPWQADKEALAKFKSEYYGEQQ